jgi:hypothetical protein
MEPFLSSLEHWNTMQYHESIVQRTEYKGQRILARISHSPLACSRQTCEKHPEVADSGALTELNLYVSLSFIEQTTQIKRVIDQPWPKEPRSKARGSVESVDLLFM